MNIFNDSDRDKVLMSLYSKRELLIFVNGREYFDEQINDIWRAYYEFARMPKKYRVLDIDRRRWETDNL
jgi:hypothetical protein